MIPHESIASLYAHAMAMELEAAERYAELAERMADLGNDAVAGLFRELAGFERQHHAALVRRTEGVALPEVERARHAWLDAGAPRAPARELVFRLLTARQALEVALEAEVRARDFFQGLVRGADDPALRALARELAAEEQEHITLLKQMRAFTPAPPDWSAL